MDFIEIIKLADIATPKNLKDTLNTLITDVNSFVEDTNAFKNNLHVTPGTGKYSLVQVSGEGGSHGSSDEKPKNQGEATGRNAVALGVQGQSIGDCTLTAGYQAKALEKACVAFGTGIAGRTSAEWIAYYWDVNTWSTPHWNKVGKVQLIEGALPQDWENKGIVNKPGTNEYYYVLGPSNTKYGQWLLNTSFAAGQGAKAIGQNSTAFGYSTIAKDDHTFACGQSCKANVHHSFAGGFDTAVDSEFGFAYGNGLRTTGAYQVAFGKFNALNADALLQVGLGGGNNSRKTIFEVMKDGRVKAYGAPQDANDVVRLQDIAGLGGSGNIVDFSKFQTKTDNSLETTSKEIVGAINEVNSKVGQGGGASLDVRINGTSIVKNGVANIPLASSTGVGVLRTSGDYATNRDGYGNLFALGRTTSEYKSGSSHMFISKTTLENIKDDYVKRGLAEKKSTYEWTDKEKEKARQTLGASKLYKHSFYVYLPMTAIYPDAPSDMLYEDDEYFHIEFLSDKNYQIDITGLYMVNLGGYYYTGGNCCPVIGAYDLNTNEYGFVVCSDYSKQNPIQVPIKMLNGETMEMEWTRVIAGYTITEV